MSLSQAIPSLSGLQRLHSHLSYRDVPVAHIAQYPFRRQMTSLSSTQQTAVRGVVTPQAPERSASEPWIHPDGGGLPPLLVRQQSLSGTGRSQAVRGELKPDLWKIAYKGIQQLVSQSSPVGVVVLRCVVWVHVAQPALPVWNCWSRIECPYHDWRGSKMCVNLGVHTLGGGVLIGGVHSTVVSSL